MRRFFLLGLISLAGCADQREELPSVTATAETAPVASSDDAADDPAIWINPQDPGQSLILGTDKQAGLYVYGLDGGERQFLNIGKLNNVDLRQAVQLGGWRGDIAAASNRSNDSIALMVVENGAVSFVGEISSAAPEPYGICMGAAESGVYVFVTHKTGDVIAYRLTSRAGGEVVSRLKLATQLEGCVYDDVTGVLYIGEEEAGIWKTALVGAAFKEPAMIDRVGGASGLVADVEGLSIYRPDDGREYLVASSQGDDSYALYDLETDQFVGRFRIGAGAEIDAAEETDGLAATAVALGETFSRGVLVVQDGDNRPHGEAQNFKIVDWRAIEAALAITP